MRRDGEAPATVSDAVLDAVAEARVGGIFWGHRPAGIRLVARAGVAVPQAMLDGLARREIGMVGKARRGADSVPGPFPDPRSGERRGGKEFGRTGRSRWWPYH